MGDHFVLLVDRLLTESTLGATLESRNPVERAPSSEPLKVRDGLPSGKLVECRICQDEDEDSSMETPCSCSGSLKYAHRYCVQRWCNEKGDTFCEICLQQFKPGYTAPPKLFHYGRIPMNFRGNWEVSQRDSQNQRFLTMVPTDRNLIGTDYDEDSISNTRSVLYCRSAAMLFTVLLVLRHVLPFMINGAGSFSFSFTLLTLLLLRTAGVVLPLYIMLRAVITFHKRHSQQEPQVLSPSASEAENV